MKIFFEEINFSQFFQEKIAFILYSQEFFVKIFLEIFQSFVFK